MGFLVLAGARSAGVDQQAWISRLGGRQNRDQITFSAAPVEVGRRGFRRAGGPAGCAALLSREAGEMVVVEARSMALEAMRFAFPAVVVGDRSRSDRSPLGA